MHKMHMKGRNGRVKVDSAHYHILGFYSSGRFYHLIMYCIFLKCFKKNDHMTKK